jgi:hypothetical protein
MIWTMLLAVWKKIVSFFSKSPGKWISAALIALALLWGIYHTGYKAGGTACEASHKSAFIVEVQRQERAGTAAVAASETLAASDTAKDKSNQEIIRYVVKTVYAQPDAGAECIPAAIADRLRGIE